MIRTPVKSSFIAAVGHEGDQIEVELANGKVYEGTVTRAEYERLVGAKSIGSEFGALRNRLTLKPEQKDTAS